ncbi:hypothetical protein [Flavobacterium sp. H122]|uniref:hypothetical protein n=1 Tax=Flavobacterium sp. H122 TaxID=2529860 RepID=UPI0010A999DB|nr:hypothetical protein [Flavobacterium sp. H122]
MKPFIISIFFLVFNYADCQTGTNYEITNRTDSGNIKINKNQKKLTRTEEYNLRFSKSVAATLSEDFFENADRINYTYETAVLKKRTP